MSHDLIYAIVAVVVLGGGGGAGTLIARRRRPPTSAAPTPSAAAPAATQAPAAPKAPEPEAAEAPAGLVEEPLAEPEVDGTVLVPEEVTPEAGPPGLVLGERPKLRDRLGRARSLFGGYLGGVRSRGQIDQSTWDDLEEVLILADVGAETSAGILDDLRRQVKAESVTSPDELVELLKADLVQRLQADRTLHYQPDATNVWLFVGVNGVGKTTTIGKMGMQQQAEGRSVVLAAGDTFRAAAAEQLVHWGERTGVEVVRGNEGGDPGAVIFDAVQHAAARGIGLVLGDTAGRLHTKVNLMEELKKVRRVAERLPGTVTEVLLVIDATTGQNGLTQAKQFTDAVAVTGVVLTKLDGTAKGGIALAIQTELGIPVKLVGVGEKPEDLIEFDPAEFVDALVSSDGD